MENEKLQIVLAEGQSKADITIREVSTTNELPVKPPKKLKILGILSVVFEFLVKRIKLINKELSHIIVNREDISITLIMNENDEYLMDEIKGKLEMSPKFVEFGINTGKTWAPMELGLFIKMNKAFFPDKTVAMNLVKDFMNFTADVNNKIEKSANEKGDRTDNFAQIVNSNLPKSFGILISIFKGYPAENIEVETFAKIDGKTVAFTLISPGAEESRESIRDSAINSQLDLIKELAPEIPILEV
jgi:hypothetical protein